MKYISKNREPYSLTQYRLQQGAYFDGYQDKDDLRDSLLQEQKYICCYCLQRISIDNMRIEHWQSQTDFPAQQLSYSNLLGACSGNEGQPKKLQHCDVHKGNTALKTNPTVENNCVFVKFRANGEVYSDDIDVNNDLNVVLNLNLQTLVNNRKIVLEEALKQLEKKHKGSWPNDILEKEINDWKGLHDEKYKPYCQIVIFYLSKKLNKPA